MARANCANCVAGAWRDLCVVGRRCARLLCAIVPVWCRTLPKYTRSNAPPLAARAVIGKLDKSLAFLNARLDTGDDTGAPAYLAGGTHLTIADMAVAVELAQLSVSGIGEFDAAMERHEALLRWMAGMQQDATFARLHANVRGAREKLLSLQQRRKRANFGACANGGGGGGSGTSVSLLVDSSSRSPSPPQSTKHLSRDFETAQRSTAAACIANLSGFADTM